MESKSERMDVVSDDEYPPWLSILKKTTIHDVGSSSLMTLSSSSSQSPSSPSPSPSPWMSMPDFIADAIMERLPLCGFIRFGAVCKNWEHLQVAFQGRILTIPWFIPTIAKEEDGALLCFTLFEEQQEISKITSYNLFRGKQYTTVQQDLFLSHRPSGTSTGWIVLQWEDYASLFNPFTAEKFILPRLPRPLSRDTSGYVPTLTPLPSRVVFFVGLDGGSILFVRPSDSKWIELHCAYDLLDSDLCLATTIRGELFCLTTSWDLVETTTSPVKSIRMLQMDKTLLPKQQGVVNPQLVQSNDDILLLLPIRGDDKRLNFDVWPRRIKSFSIFKANLEEKKWVKMESIGDQILMVCGPAHSTIPAPHGVKGNCIFYSSWSWEGWELFDLSSGMKITCGGPLGDSSRSYCMIMPNPYLAWHHQAAETTTRKEEKQS